MSLDLVVSIAMPLILISLWATLGAPLITFLRSRDTRATRETAIFTAMLVAMFNGVFLLILLTFHYFDKVFQ